MIEHRKGDLLDQPDINVICHVSNCFNTMGAGIALAIKNKYPEAYAADCATAEGDSSKLGAFSWAKTSDGKTILNLYAQFDYGGNGKRYTNYEAFYMGMSTIHDQLLDSKKSLVLGVPKFIGCNRAGGSWKIIEAMLVELFGDSKIKLVIVELA